MFIHSSMPALRVEGLTKSFRDTRAVDSITFEVSQGEIFSMLGSNGAGKTTTVNMLTTLIHPDAGRAWVEGVSLTEPDKIRPNVSVTGQFAALDEELTGRDNLEIIGALGHLGTSDMKDRADHLLQQFGLANAAGRSVRTYSGGMKRRLDIAVSLMARPRVLFLDEPTTGIDPENRLEVWDIVRDLADNGTTVFLTTQYLEEAEAIADRAVIMKEGRIIASGNVTDLKATLPEASVRVTTQTPQEAMVLAQKLTQPESSSLSLGEQEGLTVTVSGHNKVDLLRIVLLTAERESVHITDIEVRTASLEDVYLHAIGGQK